MFALDHPGTILGWTGATLGFAPAYSTAHHLSSGNMADTSEMMMMMSRF